MISVVTIRALPILMVAIPSTHTTATAQTAGPWTPAHQLRVRTITQTALSSDGSLVAFTVRGAPDGEQSKAFRTRIWMAGTDGGGSRPVTSADHSSTAPAFSSDGQHLGFLSRRSASTQVWVLRLDGGEPTRVTDTPHDVIGFKWSPIPNRLAYLAPDPHSPSAVPPDVGPGIEVRRGNALNAHVTVLDLDRMIGDLPEAVQVTWGDYHVTDFDWAPSAVRIAASITPTPDPDDALRRADLIVANLAGRGVRRRVGLTELAGTETGPRWSPDGAWVAFTGSGDRPEPVGLGDVYVVPAAGGAPRRLAPTDERSGSRPLGWTLLSDAVLLAEPHGTSVHVVSVPVDGSTPRTVTRVAAHRQAFSLASAANRVAFSRETPDDPPEVFILDPETGRETVVSDVNQRITLPELGPTALVEWRSADTTRVEGLLTLPPSRTAPGPLAVVLHGGPAASTTRTFTGRPETYMVQSLAAEGYAVFRPNPRGSVGYGAAFRFAPVGAWGTAEVDDVVTGIEELVRRGVAHPDSVIVLGWGYGGYLAGLVAARSNRIRAGSVGAPLADLGALALTTDIPSYLTAHLEAEIWEDPAAYERTSLVYRVGDVNTPLQVMHATGSTRIPTTQSMALYEALRRRDVTTELLLFDAPSPTARPDLLAGAQQSVHRWLQTHLRPRRPDVAVARPPRQPRRTSLVLSEYEPYGEPGTGVIEGAAYLVMPDGTRQFCSRELVFMNPVTTLSTEWYERNVINREELEPIPSTGYHWITRADERGRFRFVDLPPGEYYLGCRAVESEGFAHGRTELAEGSRAYVELTRHVPVGGDDPLRDPAPTGPAEWGQLEGAWQCTIRTPDSTGRVRETKATWTWEYVLGGRGVRDTYVGLDDDGSPRFTGTAIRVYNPDTAEWDVTWADTATPGTRSYHATYADGRMVMRKVPHDPNWRTVFYDITRTTFDWLSEPSGGRMRCVRVRAGEGAGR